MGIDVRTFLMLKLNKMKGLPRKSPTAIKYQFNDSVF